MSALESRDLLPVDALQLSSDVEALAHCLSTLEGLHRQPIALAYYRALSHTEIAERMKLLSGTMKTWIRRVMERLRRSMTEREVA